MKITKEHYEKLKLLFTKHLKKHPNMAESYHSRPTSIKSTSKATDPNERLRWDLFWLTTDPWTITHLYEYLNDNHIDTALRKICQDFH